MHRKLAKTPPLGWNSWDCFGAGVNEEQLRANADYMAEYLKAYGWQYVVCDIQWYEPKAKDNDYFSFTPLNMDEYGRLMPAENRFPSAKEGNGFKPIADYCHSLGLKFGIHIMRGIPRQAVHADLPIKNSKFTARQVAHHFSVCSWNTDMYGMYNCEGAQDYYNSIIELYASWGVDFIKCDDICVTEFRKWDSPYSADYELEKQLITAAEILFFRFHPDLLKLNRQSTLPKMQICGVLLAISGISGISFMLCLIAVIYGRIGLRRGTILTVICFRSADFQRTEPVMVRRTE